MTSPLPTERQASPSPDRRGLGERCAIMNNMSKRIVIANWKMNPLTEKEAENLFNSTAKSLPTLKNTEIVICPPLIFLDRLLKIRSAKIKLGAQNCFWGDKGAFTGEVSAEMLDLLGAKYVILGHSERRTRGEGNEEINKKIKSTLFAGLIPIVCVGEKERDENHGYLNFIKEQLETALKNVSRDSVSKIIIAYEPVWAIGKNALREAQPAEFLEIKIFIKKVLSDIFGVKTKMSKIIYGGSVNSKNTFSFLSEGQADGFLVGRDSLDAKKFLEIINIAENNEIH